MTIRYLLDTDTCISYLRGKFDLRAKLDAIGFVRCAISVITLAELKFGVENSPRRKTQWEETERFFRPLTVFSLYEVLDVYAKEKVRLRQLGQPISDFDLLIGATAIHYGLILVTNNVKHFERMQGLSIENWTTQV
jgi:tRNA(fMet)-specific endonuclease VapC